MAKYEPGKMNIENQEKTFAGFVKAVSWGAILTVLFLAFLAMVNG